MKLLFAIKSLSQLGGGAERVFADVVNGMQARGHQVHVMTFENSTNRSFYPLDKGIVRLDIGASKTSKISQILNLHSARRQVVGLKPAAVIAFMPSCYVPLGVALVGTGIPVVASEHNVPERYSQQPTRWLSIYAARWYTAAFTAVSHQMRERYPVALRNRMTVIPNPLGASKELRANVIGAKSDVGQVLAVGRLHSQKDHATLVRAFATIASEFPGWTVRILGDGDQRSRIENLVSELHLKGRVALPGTVQDVASEYVASQLYVIPSRYESYGMATAEAIAHGLPAIGFADCPGTNELIHDGVNGILVNPGDDRVESLANALRPLMSDASARLQLVPSSDAQTGTQSLSQVLDIWERYLGQTAQISRQ
ncbi:glycosyltransferase [Devosia sp.]|uniref:glycosyltransferase n=1 Tax=Devosia sp. TaxID=1871048 RepID=UPI003A8CEE15